MAPVVMPARSAISSKVVRSYPFSRMRERAASSSLARVRSRLSPFGRERAEDFERPSFAIDFITFIFYSYPIKSRGSYTMNQERQLQQVLKKSGVSSDFEAD